ncbi:MAG: hypothetical protein K0S38_415 [Candidatus Paceibacter sp.]|jgi:uncharacterized membrane protein|nr:hypothetical protein [Candidatus Paceibacter sp.]
MKKFFIICALALSASTPVVAQVHQDVQGFWKARVVEVVSEEKRIVEGTNTQSTFQKLRVEVLEGDKKGQILTIDNDYIVLKQGDTFFLNYLLSIGGAESYSVRDIERRPAVFLFVGLFIVFIIAFGGMQGVRSLLSLAGSLLIIVYVLLPLLLKGYPPILMSTLVATTILFLAIYFTHGFNKESTAAFFGTVIAIIFTGILAYIAVAMTRLSGFSSDETVYLNISTNGLLNMQGLLLGAIIIGVLGVLDDIAITQATVVRELYGSASHLSKREIYTKAISVGKEHVGALVNTLALAYAGASLPLLLLYSTSTNNTAMIFNYEIFATEIVRTIVGSIGLILTVPLSTGIAVLLLSRTKGVPSEHAHSHGHHHH